VCVRYVCMYVGTERKIDCRPAGIFLPCPLEQLGAWSISVGRLSPSQQAKEAGIRRRSSARGDGEGCELQGRAPVQYVVQAGLAAGLSDKGPASAFRVSRVAFGCFSAHMQG
jgi:hypothetical protein